MQLWAWHCNSRTSPCMRASFLYLHIHTLLSSSRVVSSSCHPAPTTFVSPPETSPIMEWPRRRYYSETTARGAQRGAAAWWLRRKRSDRWNRPSVSRLSVTDPNTSCRQRRCWGVCSFLVANWLSAASSQEARGTKATQKTNSKAKSRSRPR